MRSTLNSRAVEAFVIQPLDDEIADRAYELYMTRPVGSGSDVDDWLRAERQLIAERRRRLLTPTRGSRLTVEHDLASK